MNYSPNSRAFRPNRTTLPRSAGSNLPSALASASLIRTLTETLSSPSSTAGIGFKFSRLLADMTRFPRSFPLPAPARFALDMPT